MSDRPRPPYTVRGKRGSGIVTFLCPTPQWALLKLADFEKSGYTDVAVAGPDGAALTEADLRATVVNEDWRGGAPVDADAPNAPERTS